MRPALDEARSRDAPMTTQSAWSVGLRPTRDSVGVDRAPNPRTAWAFIHVGQARRSQPARTPFARRLDTLRP
jgi:hypothetical protein